MPPTLEQQMRQRRFETLIGLMAPFLDAVLAVGDRTSRLLSPGGGEQYPIRLAGEPFELRPTEHGESSGEEPEG